MKLFARTLIAVICSIGLLSCSTTPEKSSEKIAGIPRVTPEEAQKVAREAYVYGFPLILMDMTKRISTNVDIPEENRAPLNHFGHMKSFPDDKFRDVVSPNADTLYSIAWLDLSVEPVVLSLPNMGSHYYVMPLLDGWTNVFESLGTRTTGNQKGNFAIVGPGFKGELPRDVRKVEAPTNLVWILGRTKSKGPSDYKAISMLQEQYLLVPLSQWKGAVESIPRPSIDKTIDMKTSPLRQVAQMDALEFYRRLGELMRDNPPSRQDAAIMSKFKKIGYIPGEFLDTTALPDPTQAALRKGAEEGFAQIKEAAEKLPGKNMNGWVFVSGLGEYGTDYRKRAGVALLGLGANLEQDAIYPRTTVDTDGEKLTGFRNYVIHFKKDQKPPVNGFWSISLYNKEQFFVKNPINRFAIGDRNQLKYNPDGSLDIYIQPTSPGKARESNWLPSPREEFNLVMRMYWPKKAATDGSWEMPGVQKSITANNLAEREAVKEIP
ncbi:DUF1254 domain-containing protein [Bdellovibrio sp. HCB2-146]|uniref:DUF1254 domain-containing protein n=1 Tax=Bdellovibrio sp. HCB2-146 TaxID=3394362 RepID=UPI0039BD100C